MLGKARIPKVFEGIKKMEKFMCARTQKLKFAAWMTTASHGDQASSFFLLSALRKIKNSKRCNAWAILYKNIMDLDS